MKKLLNVPTELAFLIANLIMGLGIAMLAASDLGMSMTGAPSYLLSLRFPRFSFGMCELFVQLILILLTFVIIRKVRLRLFLSLISGSVYAFFLDLWRAVIPALNPTVTAPGDFPMAVRVLLFAGGILLAMPAVAVFFRCYIYPQSYDLFVREICRRYGTPKSVAKTGFDCSFLVLGLVLSLLFFGEIRAIGVGTVVLSFSGGTILGFADRLLTKTVVLYPLFPRLAAIFEEES